MNHFLNESGDSVWTYGTQTVPGLGLSMYGIQALLSTEGYEINPKARQDKYRLVSRAEFFIQYTRGKEWLGAGLPVLDEVRNQPKWTTQFRAFLTINHKIEIMFASNRQTSVLSKAVSYPALYQRNTIQNRYPTYRTWDMMLRLYLSNHFLVYFQFQNMFNHHYAGLDATGTPDDLLYNPQQGRSWRLGVNYNMN